MFHLIARLFDGGNDLGIRGAAAQVATHVLADTLIGGRVAFVDAGYGRHDLPGRAIAALKSILVDKRLLHGVQCAVGRGQAFDGLYCPALRRYRQRQT